MSVSDKLYVCQTNVIRDLRREGALRHRRRKLRGLYSKTIPIRCIFIHPTWSTAPSVLYACTVRRSRPLPRSGCGKRQQACKVY